MENTGGMKTSIENRSRKSRLIIAYADLAEAHKAVADERTRIAILEGKMTTADIKTARDVKR